MAIDSKEAGAAFAAGAQPELTKTTRVGSARSRDFEDRSRREAQKKATGAREAWRRETDGKVTSETIKKAVDSNLGFDAKRDTGGKRESTGDARLDGQIQRTEELLNIALNISEMGDFSKIEADFDRLGIADIVVQQYDKIPQLKPIADLLKGTGSIARLPDAQRNELIRYLVADHDFAKHMNDRLKPLLNEGVVSDYNLPELRTKLADLKTEKDNLKIKEEQYIAQDGVYVAGATDVSGRPDRNIEIKRALDFMETAHAGNPDAFKKVDTYLDLRNKRAYFESMQLKARAAGDTAKASEFKTKFDETTAQFTTLDADADIVTSRGTPGTGTLAETIKNYIISKDTVDITEGAEFRKPSGRMETENNRLTTEITAQETKISTAETKRTQDENEYVIKIRDAIGTAAYDTLISRMDTNMKAIEQEIKDTADEQLGMKLNQILTRQGLFGETANRDQIRRYFDILVERGDTQAIENLKLDPEFEAEVLSDPTLRGKFHEAILYSAMKYGGLRRENLDRIVNLPWGKTAINAAINRNTELKNWEETMKGDGLLKEGLVEWMRNGKNKNLIAAILAAILSGVGAATVIGLAALPAAGLAAAGGMAGGIGMNNLSEAA